VKIWWVLFKKEIVEATRNYKVLWMPLVFILLGIQEPLIAYYLPNILDTLGDLPEGAVIEIPTPSSEEVLFSTINQFNTLGILIIVLGFMATIAGERKSRSAAMVLVKPVSYAAYVLSKWFAALVLVWGSYGIGMLSSWYYINLLFEGIDAGVFFQSFIIYGLWLTFILTVVVFFSSLVKTSGIAAFAGITVSIVLSFLAGSFQETLKWSPSQLANYAYTIMQTNNWTSDMTITVVLTLITAIILISITPTMLKAKELN
jgi:ABC-2 type transport system permease protein